ncbi:hypothetical protein BI364_07995 [Acidihalobacter yilgarnensis]|uniref:Uncharacterized protein n=1 Tax=Acidihalobacter yilgarnensis TaxID=2819280 RepID=A0A1D8IN65_9GAMM|nr:hypothetical protein BI364_07995 [Acidihalobacter yilgarnensis]
MHHFISEIVADAKALGFVEVCANGFIDDAKTSEIMTDGFCHEETSMSAVVGKPGPAKCAMGMNNLGVCPGGQWLRRSGSIPFAFGE